MNTKNLLRSDFKCGVATYFDTCYRRLLQKTRLRHLNSIVIRDSLRNELAKQMRIEEEMREKRKQQKMEIEKLNNMINHAEVMMSNILLLVGMNNSLH